MPKSNQKHGDVIAGLLLKREGDKILMNRVSLLRGWKKNNFSQKIVEEEIK